MKKKKGFTLIELLAVIIILSVVVVITVPVVSNSIENSKKSSAIESANSLIQSAEYYFVTASPKYGKIDVLNDKLNYKGEKPDLGEVEIDRQGKSRIYAYVNGYCVTKEFGTELYASKTSKEDCSWFGTDNYETGEGTTFTLNNQSVKNYLIYGNSTQEVRSGKNLLNKADFTTSFTNTYYKDEVTNFKLTAGKTYTLSFNYKVNSATATLVTGVGYGTTNYSSDIVSSKQYPNQISGRQTVTFTTPTGLADGNYLFVRFARSNTSSSASVDISLVQLEEGASATTYEKYGAMPSPEFPSEVKSTGDLITSSNCASYGSDACNNVGKYVIQVKNNGKNLFGITKNDIINGQIVGEAKKVELKLKANTEYTLSSNEPNGTSVQTNIWFNGTSSNNNGVYLNRARTIATDSTGKVYILIRITEIENIFNNYWIQLEENSMVTSYEPYKEKITNIYLTEPLRKVGDYADYIDFNNKKVVRNIKEILFNGNERWAMELLSYGGNGGNNFYTMLSDALAGNSYKIYSNRFEYKTNGDLRPNYSCRISSSNNLNMRYSKMTSITNFQNFLKENNTTVVYALKTPIEQAIDLPDIKTLDGNSILSINTEVSPSNVKLTMTK